MLNSLNNFFVNFDFNNFKISLLKEEYLSIFLIILIAFILASIILTFSYVLAIQNPESEKLSSYECGFEPYEDARLQFDVKFYLVAILFIVFDIEAMFLYPWCVSISQLNITGFWSMIDFIVELGVGYIYVWLIGALNWN
jgi:NADH-quinone oxidoreductase subunit A